MYSIAVSIAIVILSLAVAIIAVIKVRARHSHPSLMAGLNDLEKVANKLNNEGLTVTCTKKVERDAYQPSYEEALLADKTIKKKDN